MNRIIYYLLCVIFLPINLFGNSMVYNFRIAQITKQHIFEQTRTNDTHHTIVNLVFDQYRKKYNKTRQNYTGWFGSYIYDNHVYYFRTDFAFSHIHEHAHDGRRFSDTETDDLLFSGGKNYAPNPETSITLSGLFGVPTHKLFRLQHPEFGYSQIGLGAQVDSSYAFNIHNFLLLGARYLYFVSRHARNNNCQLFKVTIGNIFDFLIASKNNWDPHGFEFGYTAKFRFGADTYPRLEDVIHRTNFIRSNLYAVYKYKFKINDIANKLLIDFSWGRDHKPKVVGNKYILTGWISWIISF